MQTVSSETRFLMKTTFFFFWKLSSARDSASSVLIFLQIHSPPCSDFDPHGSEFARSAFFFLGGGGGRGFENKMIKRENSPGLGLALAPDGRQPAQVSPAQNRQTSRPTRCRIHIFFPYGRLCRQPIQLVDWPGCLSACTEYGDIS